MRGGACGGVCSAAMAVEIRTSTCNRDCPDACGLVATVENGRIASLRGDPRHPVTRGFLCFRTSHFVEKLDAPDRVREPLLRRRRGDPLRPVSWDEALDHAAERLLAIRSESGPAAIFHYRSGGSLGLLKSLADRLFEAFGPCATKIGDICSGAGEAAQELDFGVSDSNDLFDLRNARHVVLWGKNPFVSNVHIVPLLKELRANGTTIWSIDPIAHKTATIADRVLQPRPGRDPELALAVLGSLRDRHGFDPKTAERCDHLDGLLSILDAGDVSSRARAADVDVEAVHELADAFASGPAAILVGWGMQRRRRGGATVRLLDALSAVSGNLYRAGGGCSFYFRRRGGFASIAGERPPARTIREPLFGADVLAARDPAIRAIWITAGNPVCMLPDSGSVARALEQTEFVVVVDPFLTDTGRRADLVLPVPTLLEDDDLVGAYGHHWIGESRPLVEPPPDVLHEVELLQRLAVRLGIGASLAGSIEDWKRRLLEPLADRGASLEALRAEGAVRSPVARPLLFGDGTVRTPNGRVQLLDAVPPPADEDPGGFPLWLFSNSTEKAQASQWARDPGERITVTVHPDSAPAGAVAGDDVVIESPAARLVARLVLDESQRRDVALMPKGGHFDRGQSANALIAARLTDVGLGADLLDQRVRLTNR
jgi:anaerobic selenocysteine-containing dehydrogenase